MIENKDFQKAIELVNKSGSILITTHNKPDGDACGSVVAMQEALTALGKKVKILLLSPLPKWYEFLFAERVPILGQDIQLEELIQGRFGQFDLIIIIDTNSYSQLPKFEQYLKQSDIPVLVIDHHVTSDGLGTVELVEPEAAASALIVRDLLKYANWPITEKMAQALFVAVATDTGWFHFSNTDSRVFNSCAELIEAGANPTKLYHELYQNYSPSRFNLLTIMLSTLELHFNGRYAVQYLRQQDFQQTGASYEDTEDLINECQRIGSVEVAALFVELKDGRIRCSLRSKGVVDVCEIAQKFGGGGHKMAAGTYLPGPIENAIGLIEADVEKQLKKL
jgi:phosphoesterase RecJ-like protein